jgi:light-regulated signal transduction histidine kinase (bacteriophytochrome)
MHGWILRALHTAAGSASLAEALRRLDDSLLDIVDADGVAIRTDGRITRFGTTPDQEQLTETIAWLRREHPVGVFATASLGSVFPAAVPYANQACGLLALPLSADASAWILWFRRELVRTVSWAGDPHEPTPDDALGERISPRKSFAAWAETVRGQAEPWTAAEAGVARTLHQALLDLVRR